MEETERLTAVLQALLVGVTALLSTHPDPQTLRQCFETIAAKTQADPETLTMLRKSIR